MSTWGDWGGGKRGPGHPRLHCVLGQQLPGVGVKHGVRTAGQKLWSLVSLSSPEKGSVVEHVLRQGVEGPEVALARVAWFAGDLDEAVVEAEVVTDAVLPGGELLLVVRESVLDEVTDSRESQSLVR